MVYSQALVFGHGLSVTSEEEKIASMWRKIMQHFRNQKEPGALKNAHSASSLESEGNLEDDDVDASFHLKQRDLSVRIEKCLVMAKTGSLRCTELLVPAKMSMGVAGDVLRASSDEPCGLRGAVIQLFVESEAGLLKLGSVTPESSLTPTFELSVVFRAEMQRWPLLHFLLRTDRVVRLRPEYQLVKRKLYSSAHPTIIRV